jgi:hypothetical protein
VITGIREVAGLAWPGSDDLFTGDQTPHRLAHAFAVLARENRELKPDGSVLAYACGTVPRADATTIDDGQLNCLANVLPDQQEKVVAYIAHSQLESARKVELLELFVQRMAESQSSALVPALEALLAIVKRDSKLATSGRVLHTLLVSLGNVTLKTPPDFQGLAHALRSVGVENVLNRGRTFLTFDAYAVVVYDALAHILRYALKTAVGAKAVDYVRTMLRIADRVPIDLACSRLLPIFELLTQKHEGLLLPCLDAIPCVSEGTVLLAAVLRVKFYPDARNDLKTQLLRLLVEDSPAAAELPFPVGAQWEDILIEAKKAFQQDGENARAALKALVEFAVEVPDQGYLTRAWSSLIGVSRFVKFTSPAEVISTIGALFKFANAQPLIRDLFQRFGDNIAFVACVIGNLSRDAQKWVSLVLTVPNSDLLIKGMIAEVVQNKSLFFARVIPHCFFGKIGVFAASSGPHLLRLVLEDGSNHTAIQLLLAELAPFVSEVDASLAIQFLPVALTKAAFSAIFALIDRSAIDARAFLTDLAFACFHRHPFLADLFDLFFSLGSSLAERVANHALTSSSPRIAAIAAPFATRDPAVIVDAVTRGVLPLSSLAEFSKTGRSEYDFWIAGAHGQQTDCSPALAAAQSAVRFGDEALISLVAAVVPEKVPTEAILPSALLNLASAGALLPKIAAVALDATLLSVELSGGSEPASPEFVSALANLASEPS